jgi:polyhydroxybutyrate depolymerase
MSARPTAKGWLSVKNSRLGLMILVMALRTPDSALARPEATDPEYVLEVDGLWRRYLVHTPPGYTGLSPLPVVIGFHGRFGHAEGFRLQSGMNNVADRYQFIVVYPDGTGPPGQQSWNAGPSRDDFASQMNVDDVNFVRVMLDDLAARYAIDPKRVYAVGMSNGAMFCHRLGVELSDRIAAIGSVAGLLGVDALPPPRPVPVIDFHGTADPLVPFALTSLTINWWKAVNGCRFQPVAVQTAFDRRVYYYQPPPNRRGAPVVFYALPGGGHTWPGGVDVSAPFGTGRLVVTVPASELMWLFFRQHTIDGPVPTPPRAKPPEKVPPRKPRQPPRRVRPIRPRS